MARSVSFEEFCRWAGEIVDTIPRPLLRELSGGVQVLREARRREDDPPGVFLLGEYVVEPHLGRLIFIYYGSFAQVFATDPADTWREELQETVVHELRHHWEDLAGVDWLHDEDQTELERLWLETRRRLKD